MVKSLHCYLGDSARSNSGAIPCESTWNESGNEKATAVAVAFSHFNYCGTEMLLMVFSTWADQVSGSGV